ncbi:MAG: HepT-like ribonuclease domain-containing protein [Thermoguttaceae bacterium]
MKDEILKLLHDIRQAAMAIIQFAHGKTFEDYREDELLKSGIERKFEIIGEAINRIKTEDPMILEEIREHRNIVSFRNILAHGYDSIDDKIVWEIIEVYLPNLLQDVENLLAGQYP